MNILLESCKVFCFSLTLYTATQSVADSVTGVNHTNVLYNSANEWIWSPISISSAPDGADIESVTICWNVNSNYIGDIAYGLQKPSSFYTSSAYQMHSTGTDSTYGYLQNSTACGIFHPPKGISVNGNWYFIIKDYEDDSNYYFDHGMIDSWSIGISYNKPKSKFSWQMFMPGILSAANKTGQTGGGGGGTEPGLNNLDLVGTWIVPGLGETGYRYILDNGGLGRAQLFQYSVVYGWVLNTGLSQNTVIHWTYAQNTITINGFNERQYSVISSDKKDDGRMVIKVKDHTYNTETVFYQCLSFTCSGVRAPGVILN